MIEVINLNNIDLVSTNQRYIVYKGRMILSSKYRKFKEMLTFACTWEIIKGPYEVNIHIETHLDIDNCIKCILDTLNKRVIDDDKNILILHIYKKKIKRNLPGNLRVLVGQIDPIYPLIAL